jgi:hypothetical protein
VQFTNESMRILACVFRRRDERFPQRLAVLGHPRIFEWPERLLEPSTHEVAHGAA